MLNKTKMQTCKRVWLCSILVIVFGDAIIQAAVEDMGTVFYGMIVDVDQVPMVDATIHALVYDSLANRNGPLQKIRVQTGVAGTFEIQTTGVRLDILTIKKPGYVFVADGKKDRSFIYAGVLQEEIFVPDKASPVVFTMRKKTDPAFLIQSKSILRFKPEQAKPYILAAPLV